MIKESRLNTGFRGGQVKLWRRLDCCQFATLAHLFDRLVHRVPIVVRQSKLCRVLANPFLECLLRGFLPWIRDGLPCARGCCQFRRITPILRVKKIRPLPLVVILKKKPDLTPRLANQAFKSSRVTVVEPPVGKRLEEA